MRIQVSLLAATLAVLSILAPLKAEDQATNASVGGYLRSGELAAGETALLKHVKSHPEDDEARYGLGAIQFLRTVENLSQSLHRHGLNPANGWFANSLPFLRMPIPPNPDPEPVSYAQMRQIYASLLADLERTEQTLAHVQDAEVKLRLHFGQIRLDFNGDGRADPDETLWRIYSQLNRRANVTEDVAAKFVISFDQADVYWLRGYCHLLSAFGEFILAHDWQESFERTGQLFFAKIRGKYDYLKIERRANNDWLGSSTQIPDAIAFIHLINFPCQEPERMRSALSHLEEVIRLSRQTWSAIEDETDDDREWIPSPKQKGVIPGVRITEPMVNAWRSFLDESESILAGKKLIPHWRVNDGRGVNLRKIFTEPTNFDLVMWLQGTAAKPYLERGPITHPEIWRRLLDVFRGQFIGFAIWFN